MKELSDAQAAYDAARECFREIANDIPPGIPEPDASLRISKAGRESRRCLAIYGRAQRRYFEFTVRGIIPEDLRDL